MGGVWFLYHMLYLAGWLDRRIDDFGENRDGGGWNEVSRLRVRRQSSHPISDFISYISTVLWYLPYNDHQY